MRKSNLRFYKDQKPTGSLESVGFLVRAVADFAGSLYLAVATALTHSP